MNIGLHIKHCKMKVRHKKTKLTMDLTINTSIAIDPQTKGLKNASSVNSMDILHLNASQVESHTMHTKEAQTQRPTSAKLKKNLKI